MSTTLMLLVAVLIGFALLTVWPTRPPAGE